MTRYEDHSVIANVTYSQRQHCDMQQPLDAYLVIQSLVRPSAKGM